MTEYWQNELCGEGGMRKTEQNMKMRNAEQGTGMVAERKWHNKNGGRTRNDRLLLQP